MDKFQNQFEVEATLDKVVEFHRNPQALRLLTPPPMIVQFHMVQPMREGSVVDFTLWMGPIPVRWVAIHHDIDPLSGFTDSMMKGPFEAWVHIHRFDALDSGHTRIIDTVQALPGPHPFWGFISKLMWKNLPFLFAYRRRRTRRALRTPKA
jgi:ligand-binding SRPBCC domain-containing protein